MSGDTHPEQVSLLERANASRYDRTPSLEITGLFAPVAFWETRGVEVSPAERSAAVILIGIAGLHVAWACGSSWPASDHAALAELMAGRLDGALPGPAACVAVAAALAGASALVGGRSRRLPRLRRAGAAGVGAVLGVRAACGLAGRTDLVSPGSVSPRFRRLDRRYYSPLCALLALAAASSARP